MSQFIIVLLLTSIFAEHTSASALPKNSQYFKETGWDEACRNETYCTKPSKNYPQQKIDMLLKDMKIIDSQRGMYGHRRRPSDSDAYVQVCPYEVSFRPIYEIIDSNGNVRYVVQSEKHFKQIITTEKCSNPGMVTGRDVYYLDIENPTFDLFCDEKRINYSFMVLSEDESQFEWVSVANGLPILCYCRMETNP